jgi:hypothetical protein
MIPAALSHNAQSRRAADIGLARPAMFAVFEQFQAGTEIVVVVERLPTEQD